MRIRFFLSMLQLGVLGILFSLAMLVGWHFWADTPAPPLAPEARTVATVMPPSPEILAGKSLWRENGCGACHDQGMRDRAIGPALGGVGVRWERFPREDLYRWVRNSGALIAEEHPRAVAVWQEYKSTMPNYLHLSDQDVAAILAYVEYTADRP
ncbi:cytochrome c [Lewinella sp. W8]|uniref:c-type cytochrome n=1 Tax=Lewinella sp. W8 TaxID=2528208 RepID=UPI0010674828|nr:cytochrome c [Lewinella sp. W8]MTB49551.1 c-type cytochrome [Lewinella sp. W8]